MHRPRAISATVIVWLFVLSPGATTAQGYAGHYEGTRQQIITRLWAECKSVSIIARPTSDDPIAFDISDDTFEAWFDAFNGAAGNAYSYSGGGSGSYTIVSNDFVAEISKVMVDFATRDSNLLDWLLQLDEILKAQGVIRTSLGIPPERLPDGSTSASLLYSVPYEYKGWSLLDALVDYASRTPHRAFSLIGGAEQRTLTIGLVNTKCGGHVRE